MWARKAYFEGVRLYKKNNNVDLNTNALHVYHWTSGIN